MKEPILIKAGDQRVLLNGNPPLVDCRVIAEERYQELISLLQRVLDGHQHYAGRTAKGYWGRLQNLEFDRTMDEINALLKGGK